MHFQQNKEAPGKPDNKTDGAAARKDLDEVSTQEKVELIHQGRRLPSDGSRAKTKHNSHKLRCRHFANH